jgi:hypothetical protein
MKIAHVEFVAVTLAVIRRYKAESIVEEGDSIEEAREVRKECMRDS